MGDYESSGANRNNDTGANWRVAYWPVNHAVDPLACESISIVANLCHGDYIAVKGLCFKMRRVIKELPIQTNLALVFN